MYGDCTGHAVERAVERLDAVTAGLVGMLLHPRLVDLHHIRAGGKELLDLGIDSFGIGHRHRFLIAVIIVLRLAAHRERAWHRGLDLTLGIGAQHFEIAQFHRLPAPDRADDARHRNGPSIAIDHRAGIIDIDAVERGGEAIGIALAALLAVGDDVEPGALLIADGENRGVILRRFKLVRRYEPQIVGAHARHLLGQPFAIDQPFRLRIGADQ